FLFLHASSPPAISTFSLTTLFRSRDADGHRIGHGRPGLGAAPGSARANEPAKEGAPASGRRSSSMAQDVARGGPMTYPVSPGGARATPSQPSLGGAMTPQEPTADEYYVDSPVVREFIAAVQAARAAEPDPARLVEQLRPAFSRLLQTDGWLPDEFARPYEASGMGGGIGQYLLYRSADRSLSLFSLVVPAGSTTPVHDHLAWGLVGLYRG